MLDYCRFNRLWPHQKFCFIWDDPSNPKNWKTKINGYFDRDYKDSNDREFSVYKTEYNEGGFTVVYVEREEK